MSSRPFVSWGAIGKVISAPKFIETGIIGTRKIPKKIKLRRTAILFSAGNVISVGDPISTKMPAIVTPKHTARIVHRYLCVFCSIIPAPILAATPKIAVAAP